MARRTIFIILAAILLVAGGGFGIVRWRKAHAPRAVAPVIASAPPATALILQGLVQPRNIVSVGASVEGILDAYFVEINQEVYQGQLLGRIRNPKLDEGQQKAQSALDAAESRVTALAGEQLQAKLETSRATADQTRAHNEVERLQKNYDRQQGLWNAGATARLVWEKAQKEYSDAKADADKQDAAAEQAARHEASLAHDLESANQAVASAKTAIERTKTTTASAEMHSPVDGVVVAKQDLTGQPVDPSMKELVKIGTDLTLLCVPIGTEEKRVHAGLAAKVVIGSDEYSGTVRDDNGHGLVVDFAVPTAWTRFGEAAQVIIRF